MSDERRIVSEVIGGPDDESPELGDADRLVDPEVCPFCNDEEG